MLKTKLLLILSFFGWFQQINAQQPPRLKGLDTLGFGLNPLVGNMDPLIATDYEQMFRSPIYQLQWNMNQTSVDGLWTIPDNTTANILPACTFNQDAIQVTCSLDYYEWAHLYLEVDTSVFFFFSTSKSASYSEYVKITAEMSNYAYLGDSVCYSYKIFFTLGTVELLTTGFKQAVGNLPVQYRSVDDYNDFFTNYGTHVLIEIDAGGRFYQSNQVSSFNFTYLESQSIDVQAEAGIGFLVSAGMDFEGQGNTQQYITFSKYSQKGSLDCLGGDPTYCGNWTKWAPSVKNDPVPVYVRAQFIYTLLTTSYFPDDTHILAKQVALAQATQEYLLGSQNIPEQYIGDVSASSGITNHNVIIKHSKQIVPTYINLQFTTFPDRSNTSGSHYQLVEKAYEYEDSSNPWGIELTDTAIKLSIDASYSVFGSYSSATNQWTKYKSGFWSAIVLSEAPTWGGKWVFKNGTAREAVIVAQDVDANQITLFQVQFAISDNPTTAYPLIWRMSDGNGVTCDGPVSITIEYGIVSLQINSNNLFAVWNNDNGAWQWSQFKTTGFFRANLFTIPANFSSGWVPAYGSSTMQAIAHGLNVIPQLVQIFFSPDTTGAKVYPVTWNFNPGSTPNPVSIYTDQNNVYISCTSGNLWEAWYASNASWTSYKTGYWKVHAWINSPEPQQKMN